MAGVVTVMLQCFAHALHLSFVSACSITKINIALFKNAPETVIIATFFVKTKGGLSKDAKIRLQKSVMWIY